MFITLEGPEGAGKTTVIKALAEHLKELHSEVVVTREPGAGAIGKRIREILLDGAQVAPTAELFLFLADRAQHVHDLILPALQRNAVVLCDRFADSTVVYQGYGRGMDIPNLREFNRMATGGVHPDRTLLLDLPPKLGLSRLVSKDRLDSESLTFHEKVRAGFLEESRLEPARWRVVDASQPLEKVIADSLSALT
jgi:dTMP kinase